MNRFKDALLVCLLTVVTLGGFNWWLKRPEFHRVPTIDGGAVDIGFQRQGIWPFTMTGFPEEEKQSELEKVAKAFRGRTRPRLTAPATKPVIVDVFPRLGIVVTEGGELPIEEVHPAVLQEFYDNVPDGYWEGQSVRQDEREALDKD